MVETAIICILAGLGAGIGVGFGSMSSAVIITPMLIAFLHLEPYTAIGIALSSDVLASAVAAYTYHKDGNLKLKQALALMIAALVFTIVGSVVSRIVPDHAMGGLSLAITFFTGLKLLIRPVTSARKCECNKSTRRIIAESILLGSGIGFICGFVGAGGGMMTMLALVVFLGYGLKEAVGTSVFVMTFTALVGASSHFMVSGIPDPFVLVCCTISTLVFARIAARIANVAKPKTLSRVTGTVAVSLAVIIVAIKGFGG